MDSRDDLSINQSTNQSISINQSINQSINPSINPSIHPSIYPSIHHQPYYRPSCTLPRFLPPPLSITCECMHALIIIFQVINTLERGNCKNRDNHSIYGHFLELNCCSWGWTLTFLQNLRKKNSNLKITYRHTGLAFLTIGTFYSCWWDL